MSDKVILGETMEPERRCFKCEKQMQWTGKVPIAFWTKKCYN
jgi:hypothetical protein